MRGDTTRKGYPRWIVRVNAAGIVLSALSLLGLGGCGSLYFHDAQQDQTLEGRGAVSWTLNGQNLTAASCQAERITSMKVQIVSTRNPDQGAVFENVTCGLDRYSVSMVPLGRVEFQVGALIEHNGDSCIRYYGEANATTDTDFPSQPTLLELRPFATCP